MNKYKQAFQTALAVSILLISTVTAFSAQAATSPGYVYDSAGIVVRDTYGNCVQTSLWQKENATKECHPDLFPEPKVVAPAPKVVVAPKVVAPIVIAPAVVAPAVVAPSPKEMVFGAAALFNIDKADLTPAGQQKIREHREQVRAELSSATVIKITGHTDNTGGIDYNQQLSLRRAQAVRDYLIALGADASKMQVAGMGETNPIADNKTAAGRAENRRVQVEVIGFGK